MQHTGVPFVGLILAILSVIGGFMLPRKWIINYSFFSFFCKDFVLLFNNGYY
jgi:hypothetical protein